MIHTDRRTGNTKISGTGETIEVELIAIIATILHDMVIPVGDDPFRFMARVTAVSMSVAQDEGAFKTSKSVKMIIPKERSEDEQQEQ